MRHYAQARSIIDQNTCNKIIEHAEMLGFRDSPVIVGTEEVTNKDVRNNSRVVLTLGSEFVAELTDKLLASGLVPSEYNGVKFSRINNIFRVYKYENEQYFKPL